MKKIWFIAAGVLAAAVLAAVLIVTRQPAADNRPPAGQQPAAGGQQAGSSRPEAGDPAALGSVRGEWRMAAESGTAAEGSILSAWRYNFAAFREQRLSFDGSGQGKWTIVGESRDAVMPFFYSVHDNILQYRPSEDALGQDMTIELTGSQLIITQDKQTVVFVREQ